MDPRHTKRLRTVQNLYAQVYQPKTGKKQKLPYVGDNVTKKVLENLEEIDKNIKKHAPRYPLEKIAPIDISILRLAIFELLFDKSQPIKVIINEAVELARELGNERSYAFVNAVLGSINLDKNK